MKISSSKEYLNSTLVDATWKLIVEHDYDPGTRPQAAAHEAGHVVVAHALGWTVDGAKLIKHYHADRVRWGGFTYYTIPGYEEPKYKLIADDPVGAFQLAVNALAGFLGEKLVGLDHPTSSLDERYQAMNIAASLNEVFAAPEGYIELVIGKVCQQILESNCQHFDVIRTHLNLTRKLARSEAKKMLVHVNQIDLKTVFEEVAP